MPSIIVGLLALAFGIWGLTVWWWSVVELLRGLIPVILLLIGILSLATGVSEVRQEQEVKDEDLLDDELDADIALDEAMAKEE